MTPYRERRDQGHYLGTIRTTSSNATSTTPPPQLDPHPADNQQHATESYACPNCERWFTTEAGLKIHTTKVHGNGQDQPLEPIPDEADDQA